MKKLSVALVCLAWFACTPNIENVAPPDVVVARFDPSAVPAVVPSPNDLATNPKTGLLAVPIPASASDVDVEFYNYLNSINGFPLSAGASTTFDGELSAPSVGAGSVKVLNVTEGLTEVTPSSIAYVKTGNAEAPGRINVGAPSGGWKAGNTYAIAVIGGANGVKAGDGVRPVVGSATWSFIRSEGSLLRCNDDGGCIAATEVIPSAVKNDASKRLADQTSAARRLEALRLKYKPVLDKVATGGIARTDVVIAWTFKANGFTLLQFNPAAVPPKVPSPNDLAIDRTTGLVNAPIDDAGTAAQKEFIAEYLNTLNGFPVSAVATAEVVGGDLDPDTFDGNVLAVSLLPNPDGGFGALGEATVTYDQATKTLRVAPPNGSWGKAQSIAVIVRSGDDGVKKVGGGNVSATETWALVRSANSLVTCTDLTSADCAAQINAAPVSLSQAIALEGLRRSYKPVLDKVDAVLGIPREEVALLWVFRTVNQPEATFDPAQSIIPFPNNLLTVPLPDGGTRVNLPVPTTPGLQQQLVQGLNTLEGFSLTAMAVSENSDTRGALDQDKVDPASLDGGTTGFVKLTGAGPLQPNVSVCLDCASSKMADGGTGVFFPDGGSIEPAPQQLQFVMNRPLEERSNYAAWLTTGLKDTKGRAVMPAPAFALLRSKATLLENGKSTISGVSDLQAAALEPIRAAFKPMFDALEIAGRPRKTLALAFSYRTQATVSVLQVLNALPAALPAALALPSSVNNISGLLPSALIPNVNVFQAQVPMPFILNGIGGTLNPPTGLPQFRRAPAWITIPKGAPPANGFPVLVFGHGLTSNRTAMIAFSNTAAAIGFATVAIDVIYHGERTTCVGSASVTMAASDDGACANPATQQCDATTGRCVARLPANASACSFGTDGATGDLACQVQNQGLCLSTNLCEGGDFLRTAPSNPPAIASWNFLNLTNLFATRDNFRYGPLDFAMLIKILKVDSSTAGSLRQRLIAADPNAQLNTGLINYVGQSLGGFNGAMASAVNTDFKFIGLNVPGSDQVQVLLTAPGFGAQRTAFLGSLAALGLRPGMPAFDQFMVLARMILDPADPQNAIHTGVNQSVPPGRKVYIQYIENDVVIPNPTTIQLINAANQTPANQAFLTFSQPGAGFPAASRHSYLLACPGDGTANPNADCVAARTKAQTQMANFLTTGTQPAP